MKKIKTRSNRVAFSNYFLEALKLYDRPVRTLIVDIFMKHISCSF